MAIVTVGGAYRSIKPPGITTPSDTEKWHQNAFYPFIEVMGDRISDINFDIFPVSERLTRYN